MGNRAVIGFENTETAIYVHWNGGLESVLAFLKAAKDLGIRNCAYDAPYCIARTTQMIANFFGDTTSIGVAPLKDFEDWALDNGIFIVNGEWEIIERKNAHGHEKKLSIHNLSNEDKKRSKDIYEAVMEINKPIFKRE